MVINLKNILLTFITVLTFSVFSQDSTQICIPNKIAVKILKDLNELDRLIELDSLNKEEVGKLEDKIENQNFIILNLEEKDKNNEAIINAVEEKNDLLEEDNKNLRKDIKKEKLKNTILKITTGAAVGIIIILQLL
jgi:hypothetical protein